MGGGVVDDLEEADFGGRVIAVPFPSTPEGETDRRQY